MMHKMEIVITEKKTDTKKAVGEKKSRFIPERLFKIIQLLLSEEYFYFHINISRKRVFRQNVNLPFVFSRAD